MGCGIAVKPSSAVDVIMWLKFHRLIYNNYKVTNIEQYRISKKLQRWCMWTCSFQTLGPTHSCRICEPSPQHLAHSAVPSTCCQTLCCLIYRTCCVLIYPLLHGTLLTHVPAASLTVWTWNMPSYTLQRFPATQLVIISSQTQVAFLRSSAWVRLI